MNNTTIKKFNDKDFMLTSETAKNLYYKCADITKIPIIDYHCHLNPQEIFEDRRFENITELWLGGDHYKWRAMRSCGIKEKYITGDAPAREKFEKWTGVLPMLIGNPLYHWSHMELKYYFGYEGYLSSDTSDEVWRLCNEKLKSPDYSARNLIKMSNVKYICTTDDPVDALVWHKKLKDDDSFDVKVLPTFRPDRAMGIEKPDFCEYTEKLSDCSKVKISDFSSWKEAVKRRLDFFAEVGCRISDHGLETVPYIPADEADIDRILKRALLGEDICEEDVQKFKTTCILYLGEEYAHRDWVMQLHYGCRRDNNSAMYRRLGSDSGFDCIKDASSGENLTRLLDELALKDALPKTILYSLNPNDDAIIDTIAGCFPGEGIRTKVQHGCAWWFNDHYDGMKNQLTSLSSRSALGNFIGMLTDSRSFISYPRHDYFRRILCRMIGEWVENGEYPCDEDQLLAIVRGIAYDNAAEFFGFT